MPKDHSQPARFSWAATLKFKIVAVCMAVAVAATAVTTHFLLESTQASTERLLLNQDADDREHTAGLLASKIQLLESGLVAVVCEQNPSALVSPAVHAFYSTRSNMPIPPRLIDLARSGCTDRITGREPNTDGRYPNVNELWADPAVLRKMAA